MDQFQISERLLIPTFYQAIPKGEAYTGGFVRPSVRRPSIVHCGHSLNILGDG